MSLRIHTLGPFRVYRDDVLFPAATWKTQKNKALLKLLLTYRSRVLTGEQLIEWLWRDLPPPAAGRNLRVAVSQLRRALEPDLARGSDSSYVLTTSTGYAWNRQASYWLDAGEFEAICDTLPFASQPDDLERQITAAERARTLYQGDYLEEDLYEDWAIAERERLRELYFSLLTRLAEVYAHQGRYRRAVALCRQVLVADRCRESVWCQVMLYHYHAGDQNLALRAFAECRQVLAEELEVQPLPETQALANQIRQHTVASPPPEPDQPFPHTREAGSTPSTRVGSLSLIEQLSYPPPAAIERLRHLPASLSRMPFVGREAEYVELLTFVRQALAGQGGLVLLEGEAGVGKTRLAEEVLNQARRVGMLVLEGRCREADEARPYQPISEALQPGQAGNQAALARARSLPVAWLTALAELLPELRRAIPNLPDHPASLRPEQEKARLQEALTQLLLDMAGDRLICLFLDDLHWADTSTLDFLSHLAGRLHDVPLLVLGTFRSDELATDLAASLGRLLTDLKRLRVLHRLQLKPLTQEAVTQLLQQMCDSADHGALMAGQLYPETEGNPLFLLSVLQALFEDGVLRLAEDETWIVTERARSGLGPGVMTLTMQQVIARRLSRLSSQQQRILEAAAVLGREFQAPVLFSMRAWRHDIVLDGLDYLVGALLIREWGAHGYLFTHDKIHQHVYEGIAVDQRRWLHGKAGEALETVHTGELDLIAGVLAHHYEAAGRPGKAAAWHARAGRHAARLYANTEAAAHFRAALDLAERAAQGGTSLPAGLLQEAHEQLADLLRADGQYGQAQQELQAARRYSTEAGTSVRLLYKLAHCQSRLGNNAQARELLYQAVQTVDQLGVGEVGESEAARVYARWAILGSGQHGRATAEQYARRAVGILEQRITAALQAAHRLPWTEYDVIHSVLINAGVALAHWGNWPPAVDLFRQSLTLAERQEDQEGIGYSCVNLAETFLVQGEFARARDLYQSAIDSWSRSGHVWLSMVAHTYLGLTWGCEGRWAEARASLHQARSIGDGMEQTRQLAEVYLWLALAELKTRGDRQQATAYLEQAAAIATTAGQVLPPHLQHLLDSTIAARLGNLKAARQHFEQAQAHLAQTPELAYVRDWLLPQFEPQALAPERP